MPRHPFYNTRTWKHLRKVKLITDPICEVCKVKPATDVDHIVRINDGGDMTAWSGLRSMCHECHSRKTLYERFNKQVPTKGCTADGLPLDPKHWWNKTKGDER